MIDESREDELPGDDEDAEHEPDEAALDAEPLPQRAAVPQPLPPETIDGLVYLPNPDYPYPFDVPNPPRFWMEEQTGVLEDAVETYFRAERLSEAQLIAIRSYLRQYLQRAVIVVGADRPRLFKRLEGLKTAAQIESFADELADLGIEPF